MRLRVEQLCLRYKDVASRLDFDELSDTGYAFVLIQSFVCGMNSAGRIVSLHMSLLMTFGYLVILEIKDVVK